MQQRSTGFMSFISERAEINVAAGCEREKSGLSNSTLIAMMQTANFHAPDFVRRRA
jgi:hypothetical protein